MAEGSLDVDLAAATDGVPLLMDPAAVAAALAISRDQVFALMKAGELPFVRVGRFYRVAVDDLRIFVARRRQCIDRGTVTVTVRRPRQRVGNPC